MWILLALNHQGKKLIVKDSLKTFMQALKDERVQGIDDEFNRVLEPFFEKESSGKDVIPSTETIGNGPEERESCEIEEQRILPVLHHAMEQVENPPKRNEGKIPRIAFLFSCYLTGYFITFDKDRIDKINLEEIHFPFFEKKYKFFHDTCTLLNQTPAKYWHTMKLIDYIQMMMVRGDDQDLKIWIDKFTELIFDKSQTAHIKDLTEKLKRN